MFSFLWCMHTYISICVWKLQVDCSYLPLSLSAWLFWHKGITTSFYFMHVLKSCVIPQYSEKLKHYFEEAPYNYTPIMSNILVIQGKEGIMFSPSCFSPPTCSLSAQLKALTSFPPHQISTNSVFAQALKRSQYLWWSLNLSS